MTKHDAMQNTLHRGKVHRESAILRLAIEAGAGCILLAALGVVLFVISFTASYQQDGMQDLVRAFRLTGGFFFLTGLYQGVRHVRE